MAKEEMERICFNCGYYFPASDEATEYGICLSDDVLEPFVDDILENFNFAPYQDIIDTRKFLGEREACEKFEPAEIIEIEDDSFVGKLFHEYAKRDERERKELLNDFLSKEPEDIIREYSPIKFDLEDFIQADGEQRDSILEQLGHRMYLGNRDADRALFSCLRALPLPERIEDVHIKIKALELAAHRDTPERRAEVIPLLIEELHVIPSNNTTRQWIRKILEYLGKCPHEEIQEPLETLLEERKFAPKMRENIEAILYPPVKEDFYEWLWRSGGNR